MDRIQARVGKDECDALLQEFKRSSPSEHDGMILTLIATGSSQIEIRALYGVGGYRVSRLQAREGREELAEPKPVTPKHACSEEEKLAVRDYITNHYDIEPGYPCAHRKPIYYLADPTLEWKDVYANYVQRQEEGNRILSLNRCGSKCGTTSLDCIDIDKKRMCAIVALELILSSNK